MNGNGTEAAATPRGPAVPPRVQVAHQFVHMMRTTACSHLTSEDGPNQTTVCKGPADRGAYAAAMEVMRTWFAGENGFGGDLPGPGRADDTPPGHGAEPHPRTQSGSPAAAPQLPDAQIVS